MKNVWPSQPAFYRNLHNFVCMSVPSHPPKSPFISGLPMVFLSLTIHPEQKTLESPRAIPILFRGLSLLRSHCQKVENNKCNSPQTTHRIVEKKISFQISPPKPVTNECAIYLYQFLPAKVTGNESKGTYLGKGIPMQKLVAKYLLN